MGGTDGDNQPDERASALIGGRERLWTPWRMPYVVGGAREAGCLFCNCLAAGDDVRSLVLSRGERAFVIMNLFPYNTGHVMIVPNAHAASPEDADDRSTAAMSALRGPVLRALRLSLSCDGFNLGLNVGAVAGAGVTDHLHEHVVPRWLGDANFMPILAATMVLPELLPVTYAKTRAEIGRELGSGSTVISAVLTENGETVLVDEEGALPRTAAMDNEPLWRAALRDAAQRGAMEPRIVGWAGQNLALPSPAVLAIVATVTADASLPAGTQRQDSSKALAGPDGGAVRAALACLDAKP